MLVHGVETVDRDVGYACDGGVKAGGGVAGGSGGRDKVWSRHIKPKSYKTRNQNDRSQRIGGINYTIYPENGLIDQLLNYVALAANKGI